MIRKPLFRPDPLTPQQSRVLRAHQARLAELFASRCEDALAGGNRRAAARWQREYSRCVKRCHALGEIVHAAG